MDWILDHFQIFVVVVFVVGSLLKNTIGAFLKNARQDSAHEDSIEEIPLEEDKSYRKPSAFDGPPPLPMAEQEAARETAAALKHQQVLAARLRQIRETKATTTGGAAATRARIAAKGVAKPMALSPSSIRSRLRDPAEVRRAFVMREILAPPAGLR